jgi:glycosyltransferase involved in cell wall biosynthesis
MNILLVNHSEVTSPGGVHKNIVEISKNLSKRGHKVTVLQSNTMNLPFREFYEGFEIIRVKSWMADTFYGFNPQVYFYLKNHLKELNLDVVHVHGYHTLFSPEVIYLIKKLDLEIPIVFSPHFGIFSRTSFAGKYFWEPYKNIIGRKIFNYCDYIITASEFESDSLITNFNLSKKNMKIIPHGVNFKSFKNTKKTDDKINLLYVGYLLKIKGVQYILEAVHELVYKKRVKLLLNIVGDGSYEQELKKLANELDIDEFINWAGFVDFSQPDKLINFYEKADIVLLLSESENYGIVVSEALAMGTPVVVTKITALNEFLTEPGCFGVEFPPNPEEVANLVIKIYENEVQVGPFSSKVQSWKTASEAYENVYWSLIKGA